MKKIFTPAIIFSLLFCGGEIFSQNIAINTTGAAGNCNALLDLNTGNTFSGANNGRGLLIPNINLATTADISMFPTGTCAVPQSTLIYNTNNAITGVGAAGIGYYYYNIGTSRWINLVDNLAPGSAWMLNGNTSISAPPAPGTYGTSTIAATDNWLGTTDAQDIVFGTSNIERMRIDKTTGFVGIGSAPHVDRRTLSVASSTALNDAAAIWGSASGNANRVYGVYGSITSTFLNSAAVRAYAGGTSATNATYAVSGENVSETGYGVYGVNTYAGAGGNILCGVYGVKNGVATTGTGYGVYGTATNTAATNIGGYFTATGATNNYGIIVPFGGGIVGINTSAPAGSYLYVTSSNNALDAIDAFHTSGTVGSAFNAVAGDIANGAYTHATGYLGYHNTGNKTYSVYGKGGDYGGFFDTKVTISNLQPNTAINVNDLEVVNTVAAGSPPGNLMIRESNSLIATDNVLGNLKFGDNAIAGEQASIQVARDAASGGVGDLPTRITFSTMADGAAVLTERVRINNVGNVGIGTVSPNAKLEIAGPNAGGIGIRLTNTDVGGKIYSIENVGPNLLQINDLTAGLTRIEMDGSGNVGINIFPAFKLDVGGTTRCTGNIWTSDIRKKKDIQTLSLNGLDIISKLHPVTFQWKETLDEGMKGTQMGFIAQEIEKILPTMVVTANDTQQYKGVKYNELFPIIVKAIQEQQEEIVNYKLRILNLETASNSQQSTIKSLQSQNTAILELLKNLKTDIDKIKIPVITEASK